MKSRISKIIALLVAALVSMALSLPSSAQHKVSVKLTDKEDGQPVSFATVSVTAQRGQPKYSLTDADGHGVIEKVKNGTYTFKAELLGYKTYSKEITVNGHDIDLGEIKMELDAQMLEGAVVTEIGNPIVIKKDTVEYNASSFRPTDNDMLVDLLKKLPGIEVSEDGTITSNGETINKITIGGKTFFLDDPQLASQNIPAKLIEKVKVVKKKSEQAEFTGIDDGEDETVIDLSVKKGMMNGLFGNAMAGGGHDLPSKPLTFNDGDWRWQTAFMGGRFAEDSQISVIL
ncbi:MAG: carboxypeptidase-like regulatory domain-containing protein, partial [Bacteroidales bacterium]|nr:carboxypeptidase-like regulatory domain-containing protein [Bacteroidales bacterium]